MTARLLPQSGDTKEETREHRPYTDHHTGAAAGWRPADLGALPQLGLFPKRRTWPDPGDHHRAGAARADLAPPSPWQRLQTRPEHSAGRPNAQGCQGGRFSGAFRLKIALASPRSKGGMHGAER